MIKVIIPMAGAGSRFVKQGYTVPKPFIDIAGRMMIERVLDGVRLQNAEYILIIQENILNEYINIVNYLKNNYKIKFSTVKRLTQGASCTALSVYKYINSDDNVVFVDSDNIFSNKLFNLFIDDARLRSLDGSLLTFVSNDSCFSYAELDRNGYVIKTKEKEVISNHAIAGAYFFKKGKYFVDSAIEMLIYGDKIKNEYYMSNVYNYMIMNKYIVGVFDIPYSTIDCVGTPEYLNRFLVKNNYNIGKL